MVSHHLVTCSLCQSYYADPRQIPCSHSFCFDCISGRFDPETLMLICPKCEKIHQFHSREDFQSRCIRDAFLASMVSQFKKKQSRLSGMFSRPPSSMSFVSSIGEATGSYLYSDRFTPLIFDQSRPSSVLSQPATRPFIAKCQACHQRGELTVCSHCENVICTKCLKIHQNLLTHELKRLWESSQVKFESIYHRSDRFDLDHQECEYRARQIEQMIDQRAEKWIQTIEQQKRFYFDLIDKHRRYEKFFSIFAQVIHEFDSIDQRVYDMNRSIRSVDHTLEKINDYMLKIEFFETRLEQLAEQMEHFDLKFPMLTLPEPVNISAFFGLVDFIPFDRSSSTDLPPIEDYLRIVVDQSNRVFSLPDLSSFPSIPKKKFLWQIDYKSVPYYLRLFNHRLFVCDKYGYLAVYQWEENDDIRSKPHFLHERKLFPNLLEDSSIIESFVVLPHGILVLKRPRHQSSGMIYLFTHDGYPISHHSYSFRELTMDFDTNTIWSLDEEQLNLFVSPLPPDPRHLSQSINDYFPNLSLYMQFSKSFRPTNISISADLLALLDKHRQTIEIYDKRTREKLSHYSNFHCKTSHICWDMALLSDQTLLLRFDDIQTLKLGPTKHFYLHLDAGHQPDLLGLIEEFDAYGMIIGHENEILLGLRTNDTGLIKCYL